MENFKIALKVITKIHIIFILLVGMSNSYSQDKKIEASKTNSNHSSAKGAVYIGKDNNLTVSSNKTIASFNKKSSKTAKPAADTEAPVLICPPNQQLACGSLVPDYFSILTVTDNIDTEIDVTQNPGEGSDFYDGMEIKFTATDDAGNKSECSIIVNASSPDVTPPTFTCPTGLTLNCGDVIPNYAVNPMMNLDDDCSIALSYIMTPGPGSDFFDGIPIQIEYFDKSGNRSVCNFTVAMAVPDITKPVITYCPGTQSLACGSILPDYRGLITATDNCLENMTVSQSPTAGSTFVPGMTVTMTVRDAANNATTCSFVVNAAADTTKPTINCSGNQTLASGDLLPDYSGTVTVSDNCDTNLTITQAPVSGSAFANGMTVTMRATDVSGNIDTCSFIVNASGSDLPPTIVCPSGQELYAGSTLPDYVAYLPNVTDDITDNMDLVFTQNPPQGTLFTADTNVTITVKDESGNANSCSFLVKLKTNTADINCKTTSFSVSNLNGTTGFTIHGEKLTRETGFSVNNAGDVNGDGISDLIIGAKGDYDPWYGVKKEYKIIKGAAYVVFGKASGFSPNIDLGLLDGSNGFAVRNDNISTNFPWTGYDVSSAGDINGDGIGDFMLSDPYRHSSYGVEIGHTYFIFGKNSGFPAEFNLSTLNGNNGFALIGISNFESSGTSIASVGDINADGYMDIAVITSGSGAINGKCYVVYGKNGGFPAVLRTNELNGTNGFIIEGDATMGKIGRSVAGLGDINGDGISDIGMGSYNDTGQNRKYVVFGRSSNFPAIFNISALNGSNGFVIENSTTPLNSYFGVEKAGDINNDGINDIAVTGQYIVFGKTVFPAVFDLKNLDGTNGFTVKKASIGEKFGYAGDFNGDGIDDYFFQYYGSATILFGKKNWAATADMFTEKKIVISTSFTQGYSANFAGDVNNDGISDMIIGTSFDSYAGNIKVNQNPGMAYVIYGKKTADTEKPVITNCPADKILTIHDPVPDYTKEITVTDNCDTKPVITQSPVAGTVFNGIAKEVILTVTDVNGNFETCKFNISNTVDTEAPVLTCPADQQLACGSLLPDYLSLVTVVDNTDPLPVMTQSLVAGSLFTDGMTVTITAKDASDNESTCSFKVNVSSDVTKPVITCIGNQTLSFGNVLPDYSGLVTATDNCDSAPVISQNPVAGSAFIDGMTVVISAEDASGNVENCSFVITENPDTEAPVIICLTDQNVACATSVIPDYTTSVIVTDNTDSSPTITQSPVAGSFFTDGMTVTITARDASNNESTCSFKVNVSADNTKPAITCSGNQTLAFGDALPDYSSSVVVSDNCDTSPIITQNPEAGSAFIDGMMVTISAKDVSGNIESCSFMITENPDTEAPVITCLTDQNVDCATTVIPDYTTLVTVTDNRDSHPIVTQNPAIGSPFITGMTVTITAKDASNNASTCNFKVDASADATKPVIICIENQTLTANATLPDYRNMIVVSDNCDANLTLIQTPASGSLVSNGMIVQMTVSDDSGNESNCSFIINTTGDTDTEAPVITCLPNQRVSCSTNKVPDFTSIVSVTDNKDPNPIIRQSPIAGSFYTDGMTINITATDVSLNASNCSFQIHSDVVLVDAGNDIEINEGESVQLEAIATEEGNFKWSPTKGMFNALVYNPVVYPAETTSYTVSFKNKEGCEVQDSVVISVISKEKDETKYGISPNNDGINEFWVIDKITEYPNNKISIYNRWGDLVFQTTGYNNTTNVFSGIANKRRNLGADELPEGTYFFEINPNSTHHHFKKLKGYLVLKR
ncbi:HYR domain-containing protein [Flavobacterium piscis]|uniref:Gliding motility-associated-like protein n=1 Tax=Flavobacterium piscis TaxID=1114874 RepID=A0ABU1YCU9_9FLAO|nr:HYR domain-containing protein [Flavobacterium piscis]MDR7212057.1 gliding motility-associated-like protein [Flavobacterium piscis]